MFCYSIGLRLDFIMNGQMLMGKASWTFLFFLVRPSLRVVSVFLGTPLAQHRHGEILQMRFFFQQQPVVLSMWVLFVSCVALHIF